MQPFNFYSDLLRKPEDGAGGGTPGTASPVPAAPAAAPAPGGAPAQVVVPAVAVPAVVEQSPAPALPEPAAQAPEEPKAKPWWQQRMDSITAQRNEAIRLKDAAEAALLAAQAGRAQPGQPLGQQPAPGERVYTQAEVDSIASARAQEMAAVQVFNDQCNAVYNDAVRAYPDFNQAITDLTTNFGPTNQQFLQAVLDTGNAGAVLYEMGKNPDVAAGILESRGNKQIIALAQLAEQLKSRPAGAPSANPLAPRSTAPAPIQPQINGGMGTGAAAPSVAMTTERWMELREQQVRAQEEAAKARH